MTTELLPGDGPAIRVSGLRRSYGAGGDAFEAVRGVDLEVPTGTITALLGTNGAGKTSTLEVIEGLAVGSAGSVQVLGLDPVADRLYILAVVIGLALRDVIPWWLAISPPLRDALMWGLVPLLRTRGYSSLPVHFLGKAATFNLLYAFPLLLLGDGEGIVARLAEVFGWAFAIWGVGLYWWAGVLYAWQVRKLLATTEPRKQAA